MLEMKTLYINTKNTYYLVLAGCYLSLLSGCTYSVKPSELRNDVKPIEYSSTKTAKVLALCIQDEWEAINNNLMKIQIVIILLMILYVITAIQNIPSITIKNTVLNLQHF